MHRSMYENAAVKKNMEFLKKKIDFVSPQMIEGKAKAPEPEDVSIICFKEIWWIRKITWKESFDDSRSNCRKN